MTRSTTYVALLIGTLLFAACFAPARAVTEFCPARVAQLRDPAATPAPVAFPAKDVETETAVSNYSYTLDAQTERTIVHATMIADTDDGWYGWRVENVPLLKASVTVRQKLYSGTFTFARSAPLTVTFPKPVIVHHAWVTLGRTDGERLLGWDAFGEYPCEVPDYPDGGAGFTPVSRRQASAIPAPKPSAAVPPGAAVVASQPFPMDCDVPFRRAAVLRAMQPDYPMGARDKGSEHIGIVEVAIGDDGRVVDAWTFAGSGDRAIDLAALRAARGSTYGSAISYCQYVGGYYLFRADFFPY